MEVVIGIIVVLALTAGLAAVIAARAPRRKGGDAELTPPPAPPAVPPKAPPKPKPKRPTQEELDRQAAEVVAEAEALLRGAPAAPEAAPEAVAEPEVEPAEPEAPSRPRFRDRLGKARSQLGGYLKSVRSRSGVDESTWEELEEALISADVGMSTTMALLEDVRRKVKAESIDSSEALVELLKTDLKKALTVGDRSLHFEPDVPNVWLFVGVNGVGKTTTIGKVGYQQMAEGRSVVMAAGDTFRAAAAEQLELWSKRAGAQLVRGTEGGDPGAVVFDAVERAAARGSNLVLADTAGRLHTKVNLMEELKKVRRVADREPGKVTEVFLVLDATTGQNGLNQAREFADAVGVTGVVLTKLDGTAKGGIALAIQSELGIPIKLVGLGETINDLVPFDPDEFVDALFA